LTAVPTHVSPLVSLGQLYLTFVFPVVPSNWWTLDSRPVMWSSSSAFGPGHASFPSDRNGVPYVVYHADAQSGAGWNGRTIRTQSFGWNPDSSPAFPSPAGLGQAFALPA
jgi:GH43 family beta-xylosidase